ncbi:MAG: mechanosensitive ion channel [Peptostreptococcus porci]|uniref:Mechanosensitive ion channel family protein n=1 Tax=Peptostreptococcus porci TaxID=2652282 RepID=A0A6N7X1T0_9FIRM|nr:mechanosensitive ion channel domain-containing protein [Peptostreptococcus porci]MDY4561556.1 mechanosensitive ion channel [Peptostreptococcus porci]MDY5478896.1 mechanosensitive ion channel [Peptostreptococcus porci]MST62958.1 mechanosensitive ion channel family protein [Peptostreptococcus porci]
MEESIEKQTSIMNKYMGVFVDKIPSIIVAIITIIIGIIIAKIVKKILNKALSKYKSSTGLVGFMINFVQFIIIIFAFMQALGGLGVNTTSLAAMLGAAGFSIGLAFKEVLSNFGSSMIILFFKPFDVGDYIKCEENEGTVESIQIFSTTLKTVDNKHIILPNFQLTTNPVINYTSQNVRRIDFVFYVDYNTEIKDLYSIANSIFEYEKRILSSPEPLIGVDSMNNNMIKFIAKPWVKTDDYWNTYYSLMEKFKKEFDNNGIKMANVNIMTQL